MSNWLPVELSASGDNCLVVEASVPAYNWLLVGLLATASVREHNWLLVEALSAPAVRSPQLVAGTSTYVVVARSLRLAAWQPQLLDKPAVVSAAEHSPQAVTAAVHNSLCR